MAVAGTSQVVRAVPWWNCKPAARDFEVCRNRAREEAQTLLSDGLQLTLDTSSCPVCDHGHLSAESRLVAHLPRNNSGSLAMFAAIRRASLQRQQLPIPLLRSSWIGGHGTEPYEQKTQQSPAFGRSKVPQASHT